MLAISARELKPNGLCRVQSVIILIARDDGVGTEDEPGEVME